MTLSDGTPKLRIRFSPLGYVVLAGMGVYGVFAVIETPNPYRSVIVGLIAAFVAVMWIRARAALRDSRNAYRRAQTLGWDLRPQGSPMWERHGQFTRYPFMNLKRATVTLEATGRWRGHIAESFVVTPDATESSREYFITRLVMTTGLPPIEFHPRSNRGRVLDVGSDLAFESAAFNARWKVMAADLIYAHAVVHPRLIERLLADHHAEIPIAIDGSSIFTWTTSMKHGHKNFERSLDLLADVAALIPPHVLREYGASNVATEVAAETPAPSAAVSTSPFTSRKRDRNGLARLSLALAGTILLAPAAVAVGHVALRAVKRGEANNPGTARIGLVLGYLFSALLILALVAGSLEGTAGTP